MSTDFAKARLRRIAAFTLIELLVVISIISLLISLLLPALGHAKQQAKTAICGTQVRSILQGVHLYLAENEGIFPPNGVLLPHPTAFNPYAAALVTDPDPTYYNYKQFWNNSDNWRLENGVVLREVGNIKKIFVCPDDTGNRSSPNALTMAADGSIHVGPQLTGGYWSYSINSVLNSQGQFRKNFDAVNNPPQLPWHDPLRDTEITFPHMLVLAEEDVNSPFNDEVFDAPAFNQGDKLTDRHNHGGNVGFMDGSVEWYQDVLFNNVPLAAQGGGPVNPLVAMQSPYTRWFFPDNGGFAQ